MADSAETTDSNTTAQVMSAACDEELIEFGDTARGAGYRRGDAGANTVYQVMLDVLRPSNAEATLLDFGCGTAGLLGYMNEHGFGSLAYTGLDLSELALSHARAKYPEANFIRADVLQSDEQLREYDYIVANGVFHWRANLSREEMSDYWRSMVNVLWRHCRVGLAFNAMSKIVDWEREDLFHLSLDEMGEYLGQSLSRHFVVRHDYAAYEFTTYVYREPLG